MKFDISVEELRTRKIMVCTPMYGGQCHGMYTKSSVDLANLATQYGMDIKFFYLFNESLITRARNYLADEFMRSGYTHLMFIDSDIHFNPHDVLALAALADPAGDKDIVCGPYPKKCIAWERVVAAVKAGLTDQHGAAWLEQIVGDFVFNPVATQNEIPIGEPVEVLEGGTGFMMIQRRAFEKWNQEYPQMSYTPDHNRSEHFDGSRKIMCYFDTVIESENNRYLSEDYMFCQWSRKIGLKIWMCPWMQMAHQGAYSFNGNIPAISQVPGATHGGMMDRPVAKTSAIGPQGPQLIRPPQNFPSVNRGIQDTSTPFMNSPINPEDLKNRAARRREAAMARKEERTKTK